MNTLFHESESCQNSQQTENENSFQTKAKKKKLRKYET